MNKGDIGFVCAEVFTEYEVEFQVHKGWVLLHRPNLSGTNLRCFYRKPLYNPTSVLVLGKTTIQTGSKHEAGEGVEDFEPAYLNSDKHHSVWVVCKFIPNNNRYFKPFYVLDEDLRDE